MTQTVGFRSEIDARWAQSNRGSTSRTNGPKTSDFEGLPVGGLMDTGFYRELIPDRLWFDKTPPEEAVAGAIKASQDYSAGLMIAVSQVRRGPGDTQHASNPREPGIASGRGTAVVEHAPLRRSRPEAVVSEPAVGRCRTTQADRPVIALRGMTSRESTRRAAAVGQWLPT